jgi:hypothetical protein
MELLQNRRYKPKEIPDSYFHEIRMLIESIIEVCHEGELSVHEAENIFHNELLSCFDYQDELWKKLYNLENGIQESTEEDKNVETPYCEESPSLFSPEELVDLEEIGKKWEIGDMEKALDGMEDYNNFLIEAKEKLEEIFDSADYNKKRKAKIKQQIIRDGLKLSPVIADNINVQTSQMDIAERSINILIFQFPEFAKDYQLLKKHEFLEKTKTGLHWKKSKQSLAEYFNGIKPKIWERMKWNVIETAFREKGLKSSLSRNGNAFKDTSDDFKIWLNIKNTPLDE